MAVLVNRAKVATSTTGTGTITLGSAEDGYKTFADAGVANGNVVRYIIEDGSNFEIGIGTYTASGTTLTRTVSESSNSNNAINLSGSATVFVGATAQDLSPLGGGSNKVFFENDTNVTADYTITNGKNAMSAGPITIDNGVTVTVGTGETWTVV